MICAAPLLSSPPAAHFGAGEEMGIMSLQDERLDDLVRCRACRCIRLRDGGPAISDAGAVWGR